MIETSNLKYCQITGLLVKVGGAWQKLVTNSFLVKLKYIY